jgi:inositol hexakisphosphate/diphosphoinositol-pentakisphosphate kinase
MKTASAFTKGMLELEGELTPILVSLVHREKETIHMLDPSGNAEIKLELEVGRERGREGGGEGGWEGGWGGKERRGGRWRCIPGAKRPE